jgi:hypothetical protein
MPTGCTSVTWTVVAPIWSAGTGSPTMPGRPGRRAFNAKNPEAFSGGLQMIVGGIHGLLCTENLIRNDAMMESPKLAG